MTRKATTVAFGKRGKRADSISADRMVWESDCGQYRIVRSKSRYGNLPVDWYATTVAYDTRGGTKLQIGWVIISRHRTRAAAENAVNRHAKQENQR